MGTMEVSDMAESEVGTQSHYQDRPWNRQERKEPVTIRISQKSEVDNNWHLEM